MDSFRQRTRHEKDPMTLVDGSAKEARLAAPAPPLAEKQDLCHDKHAKKQQTRSKESHRTVHYWLVVAMFAVLGIATRFYAIAEGKTVVWDEAHFGKFGSHYLKREFYFDVHPPLGKMLVGLAGYAAGYNGSFGFDSGVEYPEWVRYAEMRMFVALFGALAVPLAYMTAEQMGLSEPASILVGVCMLLENGLIGISRLILLDSMLLFFTVCTTFGLAAFLSCWKRPFTTKWWAGLLFCGVNIGLVSSVKWVGLFTTALVGVHAIQELWTLLGELRLSRRQFLVHFYARALCWIFLPIGIYMAAFYVHFWILNRSGPGDSNMSSLFQAGLEGNEIGKSPLHIAYGSQVTLRNQAYGGGLLHSHVQTYPGGSKQQQVTCYHHKDANNIWTVRPAHGEEATEAIVAIKDGMLLRLVHASTRANLHSHSVAAPLTEGDNEVSCYGNDTLFEDPNDHWKVELVSDVMSPDPEGRIQSLSSSFRLRHVFTGCYLSSTKNTLPAWGFTQQEVSCDKSGHASQNTLWNIETASDARREPGLYRSRFLVDFLECNVGMWRTNNALVPDPDLEPGILTSQAYEWPFLWAGIRMTSWDDHMTKFYMLANPIVWWAGAGSVIALALICIAYLLLWQRGVVQYPNEGWGLFLGQAQLAVAGWVLHHVPFYLMGRVLYLHHYYPALFFSILAIGVLFDRCTCGSLLGTCITKTPWPRARWALLLVLCVPVVVTFVLFSSICYGIHGPAAERLSHLHWVSSWNIV